MASEGAFAKGTMFEMNTYDDEILSFTLDAIRVYGDAAAQLIAEKADMFYLEGRLEEAFICRLVVRAIKDLS